MSCMKEAESVLFRYNARSKGDMTHESRLNSKLQRLLRAAPQSQMAQETNQRQLCAPRPCLLTLLAQSHEALDLEASTRRGLLHN